MLRALRPRLFVESFVECIVERLLDVGELRRPPLSPTNRRRHRRSAL